MTIETLRPNGSGHSGGSTLVQYPASGNRYDKVDEATHDSDSTYIESASTYHGAGDWITFALPAHSVGSGTINKMTVFIICRGIANGGAGQYYDSFEHIYTHSTHYGATSNGQRTNTTYESTSFEWATNPNTGLAWTWAEIDALEIGFNLGGAAWLGRCTQVYAEVDYTEPGWTGKIAGVINPAAIMEVPVASIAEVKGVA